MMGFKRVAKKDTSNCASLVDSKLQEFRNGVSYMARTQFNKFETERLQDIMQSAAKNIAHQKYLFRISKFKGESFKICFLVIQLE